MIKKKPVTIDPMTKVSPTWIDLKDIYGVDLKKGTYTPHPDFTNPKTTIREEVLESLRLAAAPGEIDDIEIFRTNAGNIVALDGDHRIINAIEQVHDKKNTNFARIRAVRSSAKSEVEAQTRQQLLNIEGRRSNLTESEEFAAVERLLSFGKTEEEIRNALGVGTHSEGWMRKVTRVLAGPTVLKEAVKDGLDLGTAEKIVKNIEPKQQGKAAKTALAQQKGGKSPNEIRQNMGIRKGRPKFLKWSEIVKYGAGLYEGFSDGTLDKHQQGEAFALLMLLGHGEESETKQKAALKALHSEFLAKEK